MKRFAFLLSIVEGLKCYTCNGNENVACRLEKCPENGEEWSCQNEIRINNRNYSIRKVRKLFISQFGK